MGAGKGAEKREISTALKCGLGSHCVGNEARSGDWASGLGVGGEEGPGGEEGKQKTARPLCLLHSLAP